METKETIVNQVLLVDCDKISANRAQPRKRFSAEQLSSLAHSIQENGLLQPLTVRRVEDGSLELVSGERRLRACELLGFPQVPCIIVEKDDRESAVLALIENMERENLDLFEFAEAIQTLLTDWQITQEEAAKKLGMAQSTLANKLRLLRFTPEEREKILSYDLSERHARALLKLDPPELRSSVIDEVGHGHLTVAQTEELVRRRLSVEHRQKRIFLAKDVRLFVNSINKAVDAMKQSGILATAKQVQTEDTITYTIQIPLKPKHPKR